MVSEAQIKEVVDKIAREFRPQKIILFGSYAEGKQTEHSDVDLLVVMPFEGTGINQSIEILKRVDHKFVLDLLVRTPEVLKQRLEWHDFFLMEVMEKGRVMYESVD
jgi:predicted nucleotidyltransferase